MKMKTYVNFSGSCAEAFRYYETQLGAKIGMMMTHAQSPEQSRVNPDWKDKVLHGRIAIGDTGLMAADIPNAEPMRSAYLTLGLDSDTGSMPMQQTFFASRFGQVRDRFEMNWDDPSRASDAAASLEPRNRL
jgi:PhnB protein